MSFIPAYWMELSNIGDALSPILIEFITGKKAYHVKPDEDVTKYVITGSLLNWNFKNGILWGVGCANKNDVIPNNDIRGVRGSLSGDMCKNQGISFKEIYGDPAILLSNFIKPIEKERKYIGFIPHYVDQHCVIKKNDWSNPDIKFIDILGGLDKFLSDIQECRVVYSSTLHGIILCHAYGIPCYWAKFTDNILGDDMKYYDYHTSLYVPVLDVYCLDLRNYDFYNVSNLPKNPYMPTIDTISWVQNNLLNNCPL
jgi:pyruvyltransferase